VVQKSRVLFLLYTVAPALLLIRCMQEGSEKVVHVAKCAFDSGTNEGEVRRMSV